MARQSPQIPRPHPQGQAPQPGLPPSHPQAQPPAPTPPPQEQRTQPDDDVYDSPLVQFAVCLTEQIRQGTPLAEAITLCLTGDCPPPEPPPASPHPGS